MIFSPGREKSVSVLHPLVIALLLTVSSVTGCLQKEPPLSPEGQAFKREVGSLLHHMQRSLAEPVFQNQVGAIDKILQSFAQTTKGMCVDCPYRMGVLNKAGDLLTTFPKNEITGLNFSYYVKILESLKKQRISQLRVFSPQGDKIYFISAPLIINNGVGGVLIVALSPADLNKNWQITEKEFLDIDFNTLQR